MVRRLPAIATAAAVLLIAALSFVARWRILTASPIPLGVDGYFYPIQLRALLETGSLAYPASPLAFYLMLPFAAVAGPIAGAKLAAAFYGALIAVPAYGVGARIGGGRGPGLLAAALATTATGSTYLTIEFVKNGIGLTVALAALWLVLRAIERPVPARVVPAVVAVVGAYATHKMAGGLVMLIAVPVAIAGAAGHGRVRGRRLIYLIAALVGVGIAVLAAGTLFPARFLSPHDAALVRDLVTAEPHWTAPALAMQDHELALGHEALAGLLVGLAAIAARLAPVADAIPAGLRITPAAPPREAVLVGWIAVGLALVIGLPFLAVTDPQGLGFRLRIAAFVPLALASAVLVRHALGAFVYRDRAAAALAILLAVVRQPTGTVEGEIVTHPALVTSALALSGRVPAGATLIVPERHIAFLVAWYTRAAVATRPDAVPRDQRYRLLPLHFIGEGSALDRALLDARDQPLLAPPIGLHPSHPDGLVLVAEPTWDWLLARLPPRDRAHFASWPTL